MASTVGGECHSCRKGGAEMRCTVCRKAVYCARECQVADWPYHKRICKKPTATSATSPPAPAPASAPAPTAPPSKSTADSEVDLDEEDLKAIADVKAKGYRYFSRKVDTAEAALIGDIAPKKVDTVGVGVTAGLAGGGGGDAGGKALSSASAWNGAATFEERNLTGWARTRLKELIAEGRRRGVLSRAVPDVGVVEVTGLRDWGGSMCNIVITRGKARYVYDMHFRVVVRVVQVGATARPEDAGLGEDDGDMGAGGDAVKGEGGGGAKKEGEGKDAKPPCGYLWFKDVSNDNEGSGGDEPAGAGVTIPLRPVVWEWGTPAIPAEHRPSVTEAVALDTGAATGFAAELRRIVEQVVTEFKSK